MQIDLNLCRFTSLNELNVILSPGTLVRKLLPRTAIIRAHTLLELLEWLSAFTAYFTSPWKGDRTDAYSVARGTWLFLKGVLQSHDPKQTNSCLAESSWSLKARV